ncbi:MAG: hypothetical protein PVF08_07710, partial [Gammaproteobacteria bacterium]
AETVATEVVGTVDMVEGANTGTGLLTGVVVSASDGSFNYADFSLAQLDRFAVLSEQALSSGVVGVVLPATPEDCPNGGSVTVSGTIDDATGTTLSPGDSLSLVFNDCNIEGTLFTGGFDLTIEAISPDFLLQTPPEAFELTFKLVINDLSVTEAGETFSSNGDMTLALSDDGAGNIASTMSGTSLTATVAGETETLSNYTYVLTENSLAHYTIDITGTLDSTILGGSVDFITEVVFEGDGEDNPTVGTLHIYSTFDASQARVIALDETNVRIDVDTDGDDGYVQTFTTWAELEL